MSMIGIKYLMGVFLGQTLGNLNNFIAEVVFKIRRNDLTDIKL